MTVVQKYGPALALMSPLTLAEFYADLSDVDDFDDLRELQELVRDCLVAIVGNDEAQGMIETRISR